MDNQTAEELKAALEWQIEMGVDETVDDESQNRFQATKETRKSPQEKRPEEAPSRVRTGHIQTTPAGGQAGKTLAKEAAAKAATLGELREAIEAFEACSLKWTAKSTVFADGNPEADIMLIGEAPGAEEDRQGKPFVGPSGHLLDKMMAAIGLQRDQGYYISNILPWRPPGNRKPTPIETATCLPFILRHIELAKPKILVLLGATPASALLNTTEGITRIRGRWLNLELDQLEVAVMPTYHPAYLLRQPRFKAEAWKDLQEITSKLGH